MVINHMYVGAVCFPVRKIGETDCNAFVAILHTPNNWAGMGRYLHTEYSAARCGSVMPFCTGHLHFVECGLDALSCTRARDSKKTTMGYSCKMQEVALMQHKHEYEFICGLPKDYTTRLCPECSHSRFRRPGASGKASPQKSW